MHPRHWPFQWSRQCAGSIQMALPNAACPGLPRKPLDAAIGRLLAPYCPSSCKGNSKQHNNKISGPTLMAILMAAAVHQYNTACIAQWRRSRALLEATGRRHQASIAANSCNWSCLPQFFSKFFHRKLVGIGCGWMLRPLLSIGV